MGIMVDKLETVIESIDEEGSLILKEEFMMIIFRGILDEITPFEKYWTHMFQTKSIPVVDEYQGKVFLFNRLSNEILSREESTNKNTSAMVK